LAFSQEEIEEYANLILFNGEKIAMHLINTPDKIRHHLVPVKGIEFKFSFRHFIKRKRICKKL
jgi:hypothetical protein